MDKRLSAIISLISGGRGVIDVGTDHAYLPIELHKTGFKGRIIATDINPGPLEAGKRHAEAAGAGRIEFRPGNGLDCCGPDDADTIVIAGMGADNICDIIDRAEWTMSDRYHLILQPMTKAEILRFWLVNNGYSIRKELCVADGPRLYSILSVRFTGMNERYSDAQLFAGKTPSAELARDVLDSKFSHKLSPFYESIKKELESYA